LHILFVGVDEVRLSFLWVAFVKYLTTDAAFEVTELLPTGHAVHVGPLEPVPLAETYVLATQLSVVQDVAPGVAPVLVMDPAPHVLQMVPVKLLSVIFGPPIGINL
jgi:hypothetical protein